MSERKELESAYRDMLARAMRAEGSWRYGQAAFNVAYQNWPNHVAMLRGTLVDPFYDDRRVEAFITVLFSVNPATGENWS